MTLLLFHHGNSFESIYQSSGAIRHIALKIKSGSFHQFTAVYEDREKSQAVTAINFKWLSKHALPALTAPLLTLDPCTPRKDHPNQLGGFWVSGDAETAKGTSQQFLAGDWH